MYYAKIFSTEIKEQPSTSKCCNYMTHTRPKIISAVYTVYECMLKL